MIKMMLLAGAGGFVGTCGRTEGRATWDCPTWGSILSADTKP